MVSRPPIHAELVRTCLRPQIGTPRPIQRQTDRQWYEAVDADHGRFSDSHHLQDRGAVPGPHRWSGMRYQWQVRTRGSPGSRLLAPPGVAVNTVLVGVTSRRQRRPRQSRSNELRVLSLARTDNKGEVAVPHRACALWEYHLVLRLALRSRLATPKQAAEARNPMSARRIGTGGGASGS